MHRNDLIGCSMPSLPMKICLCKKSCRRMYVNVCVYVCVCRCVCVCICVPRAMLCSTTASSLLPALGAYQVALIKQRIFQLSQ